MSNVEEESFLDWEPTQRPNPAKTTPIRNHLSMQEAVERALRAKAAREAKETQPPPLSPSRKGNKRPSIDSSILPEVAPKKRRVSDSPQIVWPKSETNTPVPGRGTPPPGLKDASLAVERSASLSTSKKTRLAKVFLSKEQRNIVDLAHEGVNLFYTGSAGTGKSVVLREIIKALRHKYHRNPEVVAITASTGIAACNIGGVTLHSFAGIGLGKEPVEELVKKIKKNKKALVRWTKTKVLIIDEVSMVDGELFDKLARIATLIRKKDGPFAKIQLIVTGDFFQLPPVTKDDSSTKFAFESEAWKTCIQKTFNLTHVFRQRDQRFIDMLNEMRFGQLTSSSASKFRALSRQISYNDGIGPTELFPRREDVDRANSTRMARLPGEELKYLSLDGGTLEGDRLDKLLGNFMAPKLLSLKVNAQVMCIKNVDETLVNGTMGRVLKFVDPATYGAGSLADDEDYEEPRPKSTKGTTKKGETGKVVEYPVVQFIIPNGGTREVLILPETWKVELPSGEVQARRMQLPLILAWAMSIHKSQGQTLERVKVDLGRIFEKGQAYVALSRATNLDGLEVLNFDARKVVAHPRVIEWTKTLETFPDESAQCAGGGGSGDSAMDDDSGDEEY